MGDRLSRGLTALGTALQPFAQQKSRQEFLSNERALDQQFQREMADAARAHADSVERRNRAFVRSQANQARKWQLEDIEDEREYQGGVTEQRQAHERSMFGAEAALRRELTAAEIGANEDAAAATRAENRKVRREEQWERVQDKATKEVIEIDQEIAERRLEMATEGYLSAEAKAEYGKYIADLERRKEVTKAATIQTLIRLGHPDFVKKEKPEAGATEPVQASVVPPPRITSKGKGVVAAEGKTVTPGKGVAQAGLVPTPAKPTRGASGSWSDDSMFQKEVEQKSEQIIREWLNQEQEKQGSKEKADQTKERLDQALGG